MAVEQSEPGVKMSMTNARKFYWTCSCGRAVGQWTKKDLAQEDYEKHLGKCNERGSD